jgi:WD40 repeat protein
LNFEFKLWEIIGKDEKKTASTEKPATTTSKTTNNPIEIKFISNLKRHLKSVNVARWNSEGTVLASAGDEAVIFLWNENDIKNQKTLDNDECENVENWYSFKTFRYFFYQELKRNLDIKILVNLCSFSFFSYKKGTFRRHLGYCMVI